ncbi:hypothetical protein [Wielerella bovis]|uniref:hypothetical protein n=1 Tax=Wielerella bovis TaxID=2917790 RepID=UPI002018632E|nr:hypothetical protein [Wielerella bovis]ULJ65759.1 hypothetical protein MIS33_05780 [Wielerella bovis]ULJ66134.1 hypothetical protein MIS31_07605 [Wielerella bovis]
MKQNDLHTLIRQHITSVNYLETDTIEAVEGACTLWGYHDCTFIMEFAHADLNDDNIVPVLQKLSDKLAWLNQHRADILDVAFAEPEFSGCLKAERHQVEQEIYPLYCAFFIESEQEIFCDFALAAADGSMGDWFAELSLEEDNELIFNGMEQ